MAVFPVPGASFCTVIVDASFCPKTGAAGWATWIRADVSPVAIKRAAAFKAPLASSGEAEVKAAVNALTFVPKQTTNVLLQSDYMGLVDAISQPKSVRGAAFRLLLEEHGHTWFTLRARHVKGHHLDGTARSWVNDWCDTQAKHHMRAQRSLLLLEGR